MKVIKKVAVFLILFTIACLFYSLDNKVNASDSINVGVMGAAVRTIDDGHQGIRFCAKVNTYQTEELNNYKYGICVGYGIIDSDELHNLKVGGTVNGKSVISSNVDSFDSEGNIYLTIYNIPENNYDTFITARGYYYNCNTGQYFYDDRYVTRSLIQICNYAMNDGIYSEYIGEIESVCSNKFKVSTNNDLINITNLVWESDIELIRYEFLNDWNDYVILKGETTLIFGGELGYNDLIGIFTSKPFVLCDFLFENNQKWGWLLTVLRENCSGTYLNSQLNIYRDYIEHLKKLAQGISEGFNFIDIYWNNGVDVNTALVNFLTSKCYNYSGCESDKTYDFTYSTHVNFYQELEKYTETHLYSDLSIYRNYEIKKLGDTVTLPNLDTETYYTKYIIENVIYDGGTSYTIVNGYNFVNIEKTQVKLNEFDTQGGNLPWIKLDGEYPDEEYINTIEPEYYYFSRFTKNNTYTYDNLANGSRIEMWLLGDNNNVIIKNCDFSAGNDEIKIVLRSVSNVYIENCTFNNPDNTKEVILLIDCYNVSIKNCTFENTNACPISIINNDTKPHTLSVDITENVFENINSSLIYMSNVYNTLALEFKNNNINYCYHATMLFDIRNTYDAQYNNFIFDDNIYVGYNKHYAINNIYENLIYKVRGY